MASAFDLYKGTAHSKRKGKTIGESSQHTPKKARVDERVVETPSGVPVVEVVETPPQRVDSPPAEVANKTRVEVPSVPSPVDELVAGGTSKEARQELFNSVAKMTVERADIVKTSMEQNEKFKEEAESSRKAAAEAIKEAKLKNEELRTCQLDREYHKDVA